MKVFKILSLALASISLGSFVNIINIDCHAEEVEEGKIDFYYLGSQDTVGKDADDFDVWYLSNDEMNNSFVSSKTSKGAFDTFEFDIQYANYLSDSNYQSIVVYGENSTSYAKCVIEASGKTVLYDDENEIDEISGRIFNKIFPGDWGHFRVVVLEDTASFYWKNELVGSLPFESDDDFRIKLQNYGVTRYYKEFKFSKNESEVDTGIVFYSDVLNVLDDANKTKVISSEGITKYLNASFSEIGTIRNDIEFKFTPNYFNNELLSYFGINLSYLDTPLYIIFNSNGSIDAKKDINSRTVIGTISNAFDPTQSDKTYKFNLLFRLNSFQILIDDNVLIQSNLSETLYAIDYLNFFVKDASASLWDMKLNHTHYIQDFGETPGTCFHPSLKPHKYCELCDKYFDDELNEINIESLYIEGTPLIHTYADRYLKDSEGHYQRCIICGEETDYEPHVGETGTDADWVVTRKATKETPGIKSRVCAICGYIEKMEFEYVECSHEYGEYLSSPNGHYKLCSKCGETDFNEPHIWESDENDGWVIIVEPTYKEKGRAKRVCDVCGYSEEMDVDPLICEHDYEWIYDENGHHQKCSICEDETESHAHNFPEEWAIEIEPTRDSEGIKSKVCSDCSYKITEEIEKLPENYDLGDSWRRTTIDNIDIYQSLKENDKCDLIVENSTDKNSFSTMATLNSLNIGEFGLNITNGSNVYYFGYSASDKKLIFSINNDVVENSCSKDFKSNEWATLKLVILDGCCGCYYNEELVYDVKNEDIEIGVNLKHSLSTTNAIASFKNFESLSKQRNVISISCECSKNSYLYGENFDETSLIIFKNYEFGPQEIVSNGYTVSGFNPQVIGIQTITVKLDTFTTSIEISINNFVEDIRIVNPTKLNYKFGENLDLNGLKVFEVYANGDEIELADEYTISGFEINQSGDQTITVSYGNFSKNFSIHVEEEIIIPSEEPSVETSEEPIISEEVPSKENSEEQSVSEYQPTSEESKSGGCSGNIMCYGVLFSIAICAVLILLYKKFKEN